MNTKNKNNTKIYTYYTAKEKLQISIEDSGVTEELIGILRELDYEEYKENRNHDLHKQFENDLFEDLELVDTIQLKALTTNSKLSAIEIELIKNEQMRILYDAIAELDEKERYVIYSLYFNDMTTREISNILNISFVAVFKIKEKALSKLKKSIIRNR